MKSVCILGGGASALMCACFIKQEVKVTIVEQNEKVGKKILATGNGRCNLTNINMSKHSYNCNIDNLLQNFSSTDVISFFNGIGLQTYIDDEGRVYPFSNSAVSVLEVLKNYLKTKNNIQIVTGKTFEDVSYKNGKYEVHMLDETKFFDSVVVATGNKTKLDVFKKFNLKINEFIPSLSALKTEKNKNLAGVRVSNVKVSCASVNFEEVGEVLFREDGISGIVIFNLSSYLARNKCFNTSLVLDFMPNVSLQNLIEILKNRKNLLKNYEICDFLTGFFIKQLNYELIKKLKFNVGNKVSSLSQKDITSLATLIKNYTVNINGFLSNNQVCSGGVCLSSLDNTLQSKTNSGLYFIGEVVDVDGVCGGYNLQWAWTSGKIVGQSL